MTKESEFDSWKGQEILLLSKASTLILELTQPPVQWVRGVAVTSGESSHCAKVITHLHLVSSLKMYGGVPSQPHMLSWHDT